MQAKLFSVVQRNTDAFEHATLVRLGESLGILGEQIREVPTGDKYADRVRADQDQAARLAARGVPFIVIDGRYTVPGAQDSDTPLDLLRTAWADTHPVAPSPATPRSAARTAAPSPNAPDLHGASPFTDLSGARPSGFDVGIIPERSSSPCRTCCT
ncbi:hypothetical protein BIV25_33655 [Streptomyces sp. MUSC 14]|uniref:DsbA family protein n=1 Tax=Streptomyces sp. MUSC 14 TaxID=1354889 RepID=UPI0008F5ABFB|nr:DsbA family protein [Streptomyces sp. MUSC 14]OIJ89411.1 hypothetical protein BIV25_33655 [Streptomyces sp. MUSC 14]